MAKYSIILEGWGIQVTMGEWNVWGRSLFLSNYEMTAPQKMEMEKIERKESER